MYEATTWYEFLAVGLGVTIVAEAAFILGVSRTNKQLTELIGKHAKLKVAMISFLTVASQQPINRDKVKARMKTMLDLIKEDTEYAKKE